MPLVSICIVISAMVPVILLLLSFFQTSCKDNYKNSKAKKYENSADNGTGPNGADRRNSFKRLLIRKINGYTLRANCFAADKVSLLQVARDISPIFVGCLVSSE